MALAVSSPEDYVVVMCYIHYRKVVLSPRTFRSNQFVTFCKRSNLLANCARNRSKTTIKAVVSLVCCIIQTCNLLSSKKAANISRIQFQIVHQKDLYFYFEVLTKEPTSMVVIIFPEEIPSNNLVFRARPHSCNYV